MTSQEAQETRVKVENGKYEFIIRANGQIDILRFGKEWVVNSDAPGNKAFISLIHELHDRNSNEPQFEEG